LLNSNRLSLALLVREVVARCRRRLVEAAAALVLDAAHCLSPKKLTTTSTVRKNCSSIAIRFMTCLLLLSLTHADIALTTAPPEELASLRDDDLNALEELNDDFDDLLGDLDLDF
jgi:hypothetical protein